MWVAPPARLVVGQGEQSGEDHELAAIKKIQDAATNLLVSREVIRYTITGKTA